MKDECAYLCFAYGESEYPAAVIATTREAVLKFLVDEWFGEQPEKMCAANREQWDEAVSLFDNQDWREEGPLEWKFEIGGIKIRQVALPAEVDARVLEVAEGIVEGDDNPTAAKIVAKELLRLHGPESGKSG